MSIHPEIIRAVAALGVPVLLLTACGPGDEPTASPVAADSVEIVDFAYEPPAVEVAPGEQVTFVNRDDFAHTVTAGTPDERTPDRFDGELGDLGEMNADGTEFILTVDEPGTHQYFCRFHPDMRGRVVVTGG